MYISHRSKSKSYNNVYYNKFKIVIRGIRISEYDCNILVYNVILIMKLITFSQSTRKKAYAHTLRGWTCDSVLNMHYSNIFKYNVTGKSHRPTVKKHADPLNSVYFQVAQSVMNVECIKVISTIYLGPLQYDLLFTLPLYIIFTTRIPSVVSAARCCWIPVERIAIAVARIPCESSSDDSTV